MKKRVTYKMVLARARVIVKNGWTKGAFGRTKGGTAVAATHPQAVRRCAIGALQKARKDLGASDSTYARALSEIAKGVPKTAPGLTSWQDYPATTKRDVLDLFDRAIE